MRLIEDQLVNVEDWNIEAERAFLLLPGIGAKRVILTRKKKPDKVQSNESKASALKPATTRALTSSTPTEKNDVSSSAIGDNAEGAVANQVSSDIKADKAPNNTVAKATRKRVPRIRIGDLRVKVAFFPLLLGKKKIKIYASGIGLKDGSLSAVVTPAKTSWDIDLHIDNIDLAEATRLVDLPVPIKGQLKDADIQLSSIDGKSKTINGKIIVNLDNMVVGDGVEKLRLARSTNPMLAAGLTLPELPLESIVVDVPVKDGVASFDKIKSSGKKLKLTVTGDAHIRIPIKSSTTSSYIELFISSELRKSNPVFDLLTIALDEGKISDESYGIRVDGSVAHPSARPSKTKPVSRSKRRKK